MTPGASYVPEDAENSAFAFSLHISSRHARRELRGGGRIVRAVNHDAVVRPLKPAGHSTVANALANRGGSGRSQTR